MGICVSKQVVTRVISDEEQAKMAEKKAADEKAAEDLVAQITIEVTLDNYWAQAQKNTRRDFNEKIDAIPKPLTLEEKIESFLKEN